MALITSGVDAGLAQAMVFGGERPAYLLLIHWRHRGSTWYVQTAEHAAALVGSYQWLLSVAGGDSSLSITAERFSTSEAEQTIVLSHDWLQHAKTDSAVRVQADLYIGLPSQGTRLYLLRRGYLVPPFRHDPESRTATVSLVDGWRQILDRAEPSYVVETTYLPLAPADSLGCPLPIPFGQLEDWPCLEISHPPESEIATLIGADSTTLLLPVADAGHWPSVIEAWTLDGAIAPGASSLIIAGATYTLPSHGLLRIDTEIIAWASATDNGGGSWTLGLLSGGYAGTVLATHLNGVDCWQCWIIQIGADDNAPEYATYSARVGITLYIERWNLYGSTARVHPANDPIKLVRGEPWIYCISDGAVVSSAEILAANLRVRADDDKLVKPNDTRFVVETTSAIVPGHQLVIARLWRGEPEVIQAGFSGASGSDWTNPEGAIDTSPEGYAHLSFPDDPPNNATLTLTAPIPSGRLLQAATVWDRLLIGADATAQMRLTVGSDPTQIGAWVALPSTVTSWEHETFLLPLPASHAGATQASIEIYTEEINPQTMVHRLNNALIYFRMDTDSMAAPAPDGVVMIGIDGIEDTDGHITGSAGVLIRRPPHVARYILERFGGVEPDRFDAASFAAAATWYATQNIALDGAITAQQGLDELLAEVESCAVGCVVFGRSLLEWWRWPENSSGAVWQFVRSSSDPSNVISASYTTASEAWLVNQLTILYARRNYSSARREVQPWGVMQKGSRYSRGGFRVSQSPTIKCPTLGYWYSQGNTIADWSASEHTTHPLTLSPLWLKNADTVAAIGAWILGIFGRLPWVFTVRASLEAALLSVGQLVEYADEDLPPVHQGFYQSAWWNNHIRYGGSQWPSPLRACFAIVLSIRPVGETEVEIDLLEWYDPAIL